MERRYMILIICLVGIVAVVGIFSISQSKSNLVGDGRHSESDPISCNDLCKEWTADNKDSQCASWCRTNVRDACELSCLPNSQKNKNCMSSLSMDINRCRNMCDDIKRRGCGDDGEYFPPEV